MNIFLTNNKSRLTPAPGKAKINKLTLPGNHVA